MKMMNQKTAKERPPKEIRPITITQADIGADELARAARLERMANELMIEAREIRSKYAKPVPQRPRKSLKEIAKEKGWM